jgi:hypothetical protein
MHIHRGRLTLEPTIGYSLVYLLALLKRYSRMLSMRYWNLKETRNLKETPQAAQPA